MRAACLAFCVLATLSLSADERPLPDLTAFIAHVRATLTSDEARQSGYMYSERAITEKVDGSGRTVQHSEKLLEVYPGLPGEPAYKRVIEEDGHRVPAEKLASADGKRQRAIESYVHDLRTSGGVQKDGERRDQERRKDAEVIDDVFRVYTIQLVGRETRDGEEMIIATFTPKVDGNPRTDDGKMMRHFHGRAWISEHEFEVVRVEIEAIDDLSIGAGLLARVHKGAQVTYQRRKIDNGVWLPAEVTWTGSARVLLLKHLRERGRSQFFGYRKFILGPSTSFTAAP